MKKFLSMFLVFSISLFFISCSSTKKQTDAFGLALAGNEITEDTYFSYFDLPEDWEKYEKQNKFKLYDDFVFEGKEEYEDDDGNSYWLNHYSCKSGNVPIIAAFGFSKIIAQEFALQNLDSNITDICYTSYPVFHTDHRTSYYYDLLFDKSTVYKEYETDTENIYAVSDEREWDVVLNNSGLNDIPKSQKLETETIGYDALVFFVNKENPINSLTQEQIRDIYSGNIKNWNEISNFSKKIDAYTRGECTQNRIYFDNVVMKDLESKKMNYMKLSTPYAFEGLQFDEYPIEYSNNLGSIGYGYKSLVKSYYGDSVKIINIDSIKPSEANIQENKYPYSIEIVATIKSGKKGKLGQQVIDWFLSDVGKLSLRQRNIIPVK